MKIFGGVVLLAAGITIFVHAVMTLGVIGLLA
jgi:hypothetical protein